MSKCEILEASFRSMVNKFENGEPNGISNTIHPDNPNIITYELKTDYRYLMTMIYNEDPAGATYNLNMTYPKFKGMTLLPPFSGEGYEVSVKSGESKVIMIKLDCKGYSYSSSYSDSIILSDEALVQKCLDESEAQERV